MRPPSNRPPPRTRTMIAPITMVEPETGNEADDEAETFTEAKALLKQPAAFRAAFMSAFPVRISLPRMRSFRVEVVVVYMVGRTPLP